MKKECCNINEVVQEFYNYLKSYILGKVKNKDLAEDIVQEVMVKLMETHQKNKEVENIKAWLFQVSRHVIYDYYNKKNIEFDFDEDWTLNSGQEPEMSKIMVSDFVIPMINLLPKEYGTPLMLSDIEKIPQKEIAKQLGIELSATKMRIQRARKKLKSLFLECCDIEYDKNGHFTGCTIKDSCQPLQDVSKDLNEQ